MFAAGKWVGDEVILALVEQANVVLACDGALSECLHRGIFPQAVFGDMDSVEPEVLERYRAEGGDVHLQTNQENNDLAKTLAWVEQNGFDVCSVIGATGGDPQHEWANLMTCAGSNLNIICEGLNHVYRFPRTGSNHSIDFKDGVEFSVFAVPEAHEIHLSGCQYELKNSSMTLGSQGVHNVATSSEVNLSFNRGRLMVLHPRPDSEQEERNGA